MRRSTSWLLPLLLVAACGDNRTFVEHQPYQPPGQEPLACLPDLDGRIEAAELQVAYQAQARYLVSPAGQERPVDVAGTIDEQGHRLWDWGADYAEDQVLTVGPEELGEQWFAGDFPGGQFVVPFDAGGAVQAVYSLDEQALYLHGLASTEQQPAAGQTLLVYQQPLPLYRFPLEPGQEQVLVGEIRNGTFQGLPYAGRDVYEIQVDAAGRLELPQVIFTQVLRVRTRTTVEPAVGQAVSQRQVSFLFECYGEVARATSRPDEPDTDFTTAAEVRRLGF